MGLRDRLKAAAQAGLEKLDAPPSAAALDALTPEQRAHYERAVGARDAARAGESSDASGAAHVGVGSLPVVPARARTDVGPALTDPAAWERVAAQEAAQRAATRAPYRAPDGVPVLATRFMTRGGTQAQDVAAALATSGLAARPELVFGAHRVPDRLDPGRGKEAKRPVEWVVLHAASAPLPAAAPPAVAHLAAERTWVERRPGEPEVLDEELALAYLAAAGLGPERVLGLSRDLTIDPRSSARESSARMVAEVRGIHVLHAGPDRLDAFAAATPLRLEPGPPPGVHVAVLDWEGIAATVHPVRQKRARIPSPAPQLPRSGEELLLAYLEVVGLDPADCFGAQVTHDAPVDLRDRSSTRHGTRTTMGGEESPSADGTSRHRIHGGELVVVVHRDRPAYAEGRERWAAYERDVLGVQPTRAAHPRPALPLPDTQHRLIRAVNRVADLATFDEGDSDALTAPTRYA